MIHSTHWGSKLIVGCRRTEIQFAVVEWQLKKYSEPAASVMVMVTFIYDKRQAIKNFGCGYVRDGNYDAPYLFILKIRMVIVPFSFVSFCLWSSGSLHFIFSSFHLDSSRVLYIKRSSDRLTRRPNSDIYITIITCQMCYRRTRAFAWGARARNYRK